MNNIGRREFLKKTAATTVGASLINAGAPFLSKADEIDQLPMPTRRLGRTGYRTSIVSLGGQSTLEEPDRLDESKEIINRAIDLGINYIDTSEAYGDGISETHIGEVMKKRRDEVFLTTKTFHRSAEGLEENYFRKNCERLQTDYIDLYLFHFVNDRETLNTVLDRENGAILAFEKLRDEERIGNIGLSSHSTEVLSEALDRYDFDCVFLTLNAAGIRMEHSPADARKFLRKAAEKDVGVITMKLTGRNTIFDTGISMEQSVGYTLSAGRNEDHFPVATGAIGITNVEQIDENVRIAKQYKPLSDNEMDQLEKLTAG